MREYFKTNWNDKEKVYYKRVYMGCIRAIDYLFSLDEFDGKNMIVEGGSQGGALAIVTAGLDQRVSALIAYYPALCDFTGYLNNRAGGWPHLFKDITDKQDAVLQVKEEVTKYYDVVNFARQVKVPGFYSFGYNDMVCPPTSIYSAYNVISADKTAFIIPETAHWTYHEQWIKSEEWLTQLLNR
ncbi:Acetyl esterase Axe7A (fragment) [uncultured Dysgonomonas sp.]|uniref:Acetyl esterase Axe7A n=1 Tax=uncultured Dysgonomonas sp. TaxID=206096 RepID=A0A212K7J4_9BACT